MSSIMCPVNVSVELIREKVECLKQNLNVVSRT
jgi:hypothetical protein